MSGDSDLAYVPDTPSFAIFFLLKAGDEHDWVRLWSGDGDYALEPDATDTGGGIYSSVGFPAGLPALTQVINGAFAALDFTLSGVSALGLALAGVDRDLVNGALVYVGLVDLGAGQAAAGAVDWILTAEAGKPRTRRVAQAEGAERSVTLPTSTALRDRNRAPFSFWTRIGQRNRSADDSFCDRVSLYALDATVQWPG